MNHLSASMPNEEMQRYFDALPPLLQENILQTGVAPETLQALQACAEHLLRQR